MAIGFPLQLEYGTEPRSLAFTDLWGDVHAFDRRSEQTQRLSVQADLLKERHTTGELGTVVPFDRFMDADVLLFLRGELMQPPHAAYRFWFPHSAAYLNYRQPVYLIKGERADYAASLLKAFGCGTMENLRAAYADRRPSWGRFYQRMPAGPPLLRLELGKLATR